MLTYNIPVLHLYSNSTKVKLYWQFLIRHIVIISVASQVGAGPCARIPKGVPLFPTQGSSPPTHTHSDGPMCTARLARTIDTPLETYFFVPPCKFSCEMCADCIVGEACVYTELRSVWSARCTSWFHFSVLQNTFDACQLVSL